MELSVYLCKEGIVQDILCFQGQGEQKNSKKNHWGGLNYERTSFTDFLKKYLRCSVLICNKVKKLLLLNNRRMHKNIWFGEGWTWILILIPLINWLTLMKLFNFHSLALFFYLQSRSKNSNCRVTMSIKWDNANKYNVWHLANTQ